MDSFLWSFVLATHVSLLDDNSVLFADKYGVHINALWIQPFAGASPLCAEDFISTLSLPSHDAPGPDLHNCNPRSLKKTWRQKRMAAYATPARLLRQTRASLVAPDSPGSAEGSGLLVQAMLSARARVRAVFNVTS